MRLPDTSTVIHHAHGLFDPTNGGESNAVITAFVGIFLVFGSTGTVVTMIVIAKNKSLHNPSNFFIFSLCISDLISGVICSPLWAYRRTYGFHRWEWGEGLCKYYIKNYIMSVYSEQY